MEAYGKILLIAMPIFLGLVLMEKFWGWRRGKDLVRHMDMVSSLSSGVTNVTKDVLGLAITIISYQWLVDKIAIVHIRSSFWVYLIAFIVLDFSGYCIHRIQHEINLFWNGHIIHHSSEEFNLACALRQSISSFVKIFIVFLLPAALLGVPDKVIAIVAPLHLFAQFWYHTQLIHKMGWLEKIIVTPSHHRVHHAMNKEYMDKNYGQILIIWDKLLGTFQEEMPEVPAVYGIPRPVRTWNPIKINFIHLGLLIRDAWQTKHWKDKLRIWFMPTGWRPADVSASHPIYKIEEVYHFSKYDTNHSKIMLLFTWVQLVFLLLFVSYLFGNIASIGNPLIFYYGAFIFLFVYALTEFMDGSRFALVWEMLKNLMGVVLIYQLGDWFGISKFNGWVSTALIAYFLVSLLFAAWIAIRGYHKNTDVMPMANPA